MRRAARSFSGKLLLGGIALCLVLIAGLSAFLLVSRDRQTRGAALSNADNRALVVRQLLQHITAYQSGAAAAELAQQPALVAALAQPSPPTAVARVLGSSAPVQLPNEYIVVTDARGGVVYTSEPADTPHADATLPSVRGALQGGRAAGIELLQQRLPAYDAAAPVTYGGHLYGTVVYIAPLSLQLSQFATITQFPTAFVPVGDPDIVLRLQGGHGVTAATPDALRAGFRSGEDLVHATYTATGVDGQTREVAGSFAALAAPMGTTPAAYVGVEAPLSTFVGDARNDEVTIALIALFAVFTTALAVFAFVGRFVRRPVLVLERGVGRIAGGDLTTDVPVTSDDELGRLARSVNHMRAELARYITEIERARARLDAAVERLGGVSRALTTTTHGVPALRSAVVRAAASLAGEGAAAVLLQRDGDSLVPQAAHAVEGGPPSLDAWEVTGDLLDGRAVRVDSAPQGWRAGGLLAVPMFYQDRVVGALAVITRAGAAPVEGDEQSLAVLANNAAIAMENTRLFEQERETVRRLTELDRMKTDFLATVQHELRTPLTAIMGMSDLLEMCWDMWDDEPKQDALRDIQTAARNLYDIVETMIDFSLLESDNLGLNPVRTPVLGAVRQALEAVRGKHRDSLPVSVEVDVPESLEVYADATRFEQVVRALLDNAVKFTPEGGHVTVRAALREASEMAEIEVVDDGIGIPDEVMPRIFERFFQADNTATRAYGGTGMGLALVRRLVDAHGAAVVVESEPGAGSTFRLVWPAVPAASAGEAREVAELRGEAVRLPRDVEGAPAG